MSDREHLIQALSDRRFQPLVDEWPACRRRELLEDLARDWAIGSRARLWSPTD